MPSSTWSTSCPISLLKSKAGDTDTKSFSNRLTYGSRDIYAWWFTIPPLGGMVNHFVQLDIPYHLRTHSDIDHNIIVLQIFESHIPHHCDFATMSPLG